MVDEWILVGSALVLGRGGTGSGAFFISVTRTKWHEWIDYENTVAQIKGGLVKDCAGGNVSQTDNWLGRL